MSPRQLQQACVQMTIIEKAIGKRCDEGFIVVAVLWILAALATLASVYAIYVANTVSAARVHDDRIQAQALVSAAVELTAYQIDSGRSGNAAHAGRVPLRHGGRRCRGGLPLGSRADRSQSTPRRSCWPDCSPRSARAPRTPDTSPTVS